MSIGERVIEIVRDQIGVDEVTSETRLVEDLNVDSLDTIELVMEIEEEFDLSIPDELVDENAIKTVGDVIERVEKLLLEQKG